MYVYNTKGQYLVVLSYSYKRVLKKCSYKRVQNFSFVPGQEKFRTDAECGPRPRMECDTLAGHRVGGAYIACMHLSSTLRTTMD